MDQKPTPAAPILEQWDLTSEFSIIVQPAVRRLQEVCEQYHVPMLCLFVPRFVNELQLERYTVRVRRDFWSPLKHHLAYSMMEPRELGAFDPAGPNFTVRREHMQEVAVAATAVYDACQALRLPCVMSICVGNSDEVTDYESWTRPRTATMAPRIISLVAHVIFADIFGAEHEPLRSPSHG